MDLDRGEDRGRDYAAPLASHVYRIGDRQTAVIGLKTLPESKNDDLNKKHNTNVAEEREGQQIGRLALVLESEGFDECDLIGARRLSANDNN